MNTTKKSQTHPERNTPLPADKNNSKRIDSKFLTLVKPIKKELAREGSFHEVINNLENLHYQYDVTTFRDGIGYVTLPCNDDLKIHISAKRDENKAEICIAQWYEHHEASHEFYIKYNNGVTGDYFFQAEFELVHNEWDPDADEDSPRFINEGDGVIGSIECTAYDFQEFIENAVFELATKYEIELHPKRVTYKREIS